METPRLKKLALIGLILSAASCAREEIGPVKFTSDLCRRVDLVDAESGAPIVGAEDLALDIERGRLFVSAYDRRAVEKAVRKRADRIPNGGIYVAPIAEFADSGSITVAPLMQPGDIAGGLRPHGVAYDAGNHELIFVNRTYQRINKQWHLTPRLQRMGANGEVYVGPAADIRCGANDVVATRQQTFFSFDHGTCGWRSAVEDVFRLRRSGVAMDSDKVVYSKVAFANGLAHAEDGMLALAATRDRQLLLFDERSGELEMTAAFNLPGGPDNLSISADGGVVAATHPSMWRLALDRRLGLGRAPSRIVKVARNGSVSVLFDDPSGDLFSAATVGVEVGDMLVAGSVTDSGLLVCKARA